MRMIVDCENGKFCNVDENTCRVVVFPEISVLKGHLVVFYNKDGEEVFRVYSKECSEILKYEYFRDQGFKNVKFLEYQKTSPMLIFKSKE